MGRLSCSVSLLQVRISCQSHGDEGGSVCLPEVINLHQKSNDVKMSFEHLQLSEAVSGLFLSDAQHAASLEGRGGRGGQFICSTGKFRFKNCSFNT